LKDGDNLEDSEKRKQLTESGDDDNFNMLDTFDGVRYYDIITPYTNYRQKDGILTAFVIVVLTNVRPVNNEDFELVYTLQYMNTGNTYFLKEKELRKDRLSIDETKYYFFSNKDPDIESIKLHITEISGEVMMQGYLEDPREF
jgi:hypothetical protein